MGTTYLMDVIYKHESNSREMGSTNFKACTWPSTEIKEERASTVGIMEANQV